MCMESKAMGLIDGDKSACLHCCHKQRPCPNYCYCCTQDSECAALGMCKYHWPHCISHSYCNCVS